MDVESRKSFRHGFILKESDLRRLVDLAVQQLAKLPDARARPSQFRMKYRNGVFADTDSIDEVLTQENSGSGQLVRLSYEQTTEEATPSRINLEFINADEDDESGSVSLRYHVFGHNRDWVFVTSSLLEERFDKIRRFAPNQWMGRSPSRLFATLIIPLFGFALAMTGALSLDRSSRPSAKLESAIKAGEVKDPVQAILLVERERDLRDAPQAFLRPMGLLAAAILALVLIWWFFYKYYPVYNFCWGDYVDEFNRKEAARRFWLVVVAIGLGLSFFGSLLANKIHW